MTHRFDDETVAAVTGHMNGDHPADNLLIARAFEPEAHAVAADMRTFDGDGGSWRAVDGEGRESTVRVPWPGAPIAARGEVRREIVALYDEACRMLGETPRPH